MRTRLLVASLLTLSAWACSMSSNGDLDQHGGSGGSAGSGSLSCQAPQCGGCEGCYDLCFCVTGDPNGCLDVCGATSTGVCAAPDCSACGGCMDLCLCTTSDQNACNTACGMGSGGTGGSGVGGSGAGGSGAGVGGTGVGGSGVGGSGVGGSGVGGSSSGGCADDGSGWNSQWQQWECEVLELTNQRRAQPQSCGGVPYPPVGPLQMQPQLRYSARNHAKNMGDNNFFDHNDPQGKSPFDRMQAAGYQGNTMGENIAAGQTSPSSVVQGWMNSPGHCTNIMEGSYKDLGVGYYFGPNSQYGHLWVQNFGG